MNPERSRSHQSSQRLRLIEIRRMAKFDTLPIHTDYSHRSTSSTTTVSVDRTNYVLVISCAYDAAGTLIETIAYIALDEHDHINIGKQLESYM